MKDVEYMLGKKPQPVFYWIFCWAVCAPLMIGVSILLFAHLIFLLFAPEYNLKDYRCLPNSMNTGLVMYPWRGSKFEFRFDSNVFYCINKFKTNLVGRVITTLLTHFPSKGRKPENNFVSYNLQDKNYTKNNNILSNSKTVLDFFAEVQNQILNVWI